MLAQGCLQLGKRKALMLFSMIPVVEKLQHGHCNASCLAHQHCHVKMPDCITVLPVASDMMMACISAALTGLTSSALPQHEAMSDARGLLGAP